MSASSGDTEVWPSSQPKLLAAGDMLGCDKENDRNGAHADLGSTLCFPAEFPFEFDFLSQSSALASPVESVQDSTETENSDDEEDFLAGLTRRLSQSSIRETRKLSVSSYACEKTQKNGALARSPQSTLTRMGSWSARSAVSSDGSPNGPSQFPSPTSTPFTVKDDTWDVIYAAAGQVARLKMTGELLPDYSSQTRGLFSSPPAATQDFAAKIPNNVVYQTHTIAQTNQQLNQLHKRVRQEQILKQQCSTMWARQAKASWLLEQQQFPNREQGNGCCSDHCVRGRCSPRTTWPPLQAHHATPPSRNCRFSVGGVPLVGSGVNPRCAGTGVFLPRQYDGSNAEHRKKTSWSTVSMPNKFVHTPKFDVEAAKPRFADGFSTGHDAIAMARRKAALLHHGRPLRQDGAGNQDLRLPQEWTY